MALTNTKTTYIRYELRLDLLKKQITQAKLEFRALNNYIRQGTSASLITHGTPAMSGAPIIPGGQGDPNKKQKESYRQAIRHTHDLDSAFAQYQKISVKSLRQRFSQFDKYNRALERYALKAGSGLSFSDEANILRTRKNFDAYTRQLQGLYRSGRLAPEAEAEYRQFVPAQMRDTRQRFKSLTNIQAPLRALGNSIDISVSRLASRISGLQQDFDFSRQPGQGRYYSPQRVHRDVRQAERIHQDVMAQKEQIRVSIEQRRLSLKSLVGARNAVERKHLQGIINQELKRLQVMQSQVVAATALRDRLRQHRHSVSGHRGGYLGRVGRGLGGFFTSPRLPHWSIVAFRIGGLLASFRLLAGALGSLVDKIKQQAYDLSEISESRFLFERKFGTVEGSKRYDKIQRLAFGSLFENRELGAAERKLVDKFGTGVGLESIVLDQDKKEGRTRDISFYELFRTFKAVQRTDPKQDETPLNTIMNLLSAGRLPDANTALGSLLRRSKNKLQADFKRAGGLGGGGGHLAFIQHLRTPAGLQQLYTQVAKDFIKSGRLSKTDETKDIGSTILSKLTGRMKVLEENRKKLKTLTLGEFSQLAPVSPAVAQLQTEYEPKYMQTYQSNLSDFLMIVENFYTSFFHSGIQLKVLVDLKAEATGWMTTLTKLLVSLNSLWLFLGTAFVTVSRSLRLVVELVTYLYNLIKPFADAILKLFIVVLGTVNDILAFVLEKVSNADTEFRFMSDVLLHHFETGQIGIWEMLGKTLWGFIKNIWNLIVSITDSIKNWAKETWLGLMPLARFTVRSVASPEYADKFDKKSKSLQGNVMARYNLETLHNDVGTVRDIVANRLSEFATSMKDSLGKQFKKDYGIDLSKWADTNYAFLGTKFLTKSGGGSTDDFRLMQRVFKTTRGDYDNPEVQKLLRLIIEAIKEGNPDYTVSTAGNIE